eukprot:270929_1
MKQKEDGKCFEGRRFNASFVIIEFIFCGLYILYNATQQRNIALKCGLVFAIFSFIADYGIQFHIKGTRTVQGINNPFYMFLFFFNFSFWTSISYMSFGISIYMCLMNNELPSIDTVLFVLFYCLLPFVSNYIKILDCEIIADRE